MKKSSKGFNIISGDRIIDWEIWVNKAGKVLDGATVTDAPGTGHEIVSGSVQVFGYEVGLNGVKEDTGASVHTNTNFPVTLDGTMAYKITYKTKVTAESPAGEQTFTNTATLTNDPNTETSNGSQKITYGEALGKSKISSNNYKSEWEIKYNYNLAMIPAPDTGEYNITDTLAGPHKIDFDSIKVYKMPDENGLVVPGEAGTLVDDNGTVYEIIENSATNSFQLKFKSNITDAYRITYTADYTDGDFYTDGNATFTNTVSNGTINKTANYGIGQGILTKDYTLDLAAQQLTWTIRITADNKAITNLKLTDVFSGGKQTINGTIQITGTSDSSYIITEDGPTQGFTITSINIAKGNTATITYTTNYEVLTGGGVHPEYKNTAKIEWTDDKDYTIQVDKSYKPGTTTSNNGSKAGKYNYQTQEFTWGIKINFNKKDIQGAVLSDTLGPGHKIIADSFKIYDFTPTGTSDTGGTLGPEANLTAPDDYTLVVDSDKTGFTLTFDEGLASGKNNKAYYVEYKTKDSDGIIGLSTEEQADQITNKGSYTNIATFTTKDANHNLESTPITVKDANRLISKGVTAQSSSEGTLTWTIDINKSLSDLGVVVLKDMPSDNLMLIRDSIEISFMNINENSGVASSGSWATPSSDDITFNDEDGSFELKLGDLSGKAVQVRYKTFVLGLKDESYNNSATITYSFSDETSDNQENEGGVSNKFGFSRSSAFTSSSKGTVKFQKIGSDMAQLAGVRFELIKKISGTEYLIREAISDGNGYFEFVKIGYGNYIIREDSMTTPAGYVPAADLAFTMDADTDILLSGNESKIITVTNEKIHQAVQLIKVDSADGAKGLAGAVFTLHKASDDAQITHDAGGNPLGELVTDSNGKLIVNNLLPGQYYFKEITPPEHYLLPLGDAAKTAAFVIALNQTVLTTKDKDDQDLKIINTRGKGKIVITKVDELTGEPLDGVVFELYNKDRSTERTGTTDGNGTITFDNLPYDTYSITETSAHPDYVPNPEPIKVTLDGEQDAAAVEVTIENTEKDHSVRLIKYNDSKTSRLQGAIFELRKKLGDIYEAVTGIAVDLLTTNKDGEIYLENLAPGDYQFIETKAPAGYRLNSDPVEFKIGENQTSTVVVEKTNRRNDDSGGGAPEEPKKPGEPEEPAEPGEPEEPGKPGEPEEPETPVIEETTEEETPVGGEVEVPEGGTPEVSNPPENGTVTIDEDGNWTYTPNPGFTGKDRFTIRITHPDGTSEEILIEIEVGEVPLGSVMPDEPGKLTQTGKLPQTGERSPLINYLLGLSMILLGWVLFRRSSHRQEQ